jgi:CheY-like chemotaxis protein
MLKILLVEDNEMNRDMLARRLAKKGYEVVMAVNGAEGVELASHPFPVMPFSRKRKCAFGHRLCSLRRKACENAGSPQKDGHRAHDVRVRACPGWRRV